MSRRSAVRPLIPPERRRPEVRVEVTAAVVPARIAAAYLGVAEKTLANWRVMGIGPAYVQYVPGGDVHFRIRTLDEFIDAHERASTTDPTGPPPGAPGEEVRS